jgi:hypothetical protein
LNEDGLIHGLHRWREIVIRGSRYQGMTLSKIAPAIFALPWMVLLFVI